MIPSKLTRAWSTSPVWPLLSCKCLQKKGGKETHPNSLLIMVHHSCWVSDLESQATVLPRPMLSTISWWVQWCSCKPRLWPQQCWSSWRGLGDVDNDQQFPCAHAPEECVPTEPCPHSSLTGQAATSICQCSPQCSTHLEPEQWVQRAPRACLAWALLLCPALRRAKSYRRAAGNYWVKGFFKLFHFKQNWGITIK